MTYHWSNTILKLKAIHVMYAKLCSNARVSKAVFYVYPAARPIIKVTVFFDALTTCERENPDELFVRDAV
jgi:hypothetical protein